LTAVQQRPSIQIGPVPQTPLPAQSQIKPAFAPPTQRNVAPSHVPPGQEVAQARPLSGPPLQNVEQVLPGQLASALHGLLALTPAAHRPSAQSAWCPHGFKPRTHVPRHFPAQIPRGQSSSIAQGLPLFDPPAHRLGQPASSVQVLPLLAPPRHIRPVQLSTPLHLLVSAQSVALAHNFAQLSHFPPRQLASVSQGSPLLSLSSLHVANSGIHPSRNAQQEGAIPFVQTPGLHVPVPGMPQSSFVAHAPVSPEVHWPVVVLQTPG
jgi:hypothetical protein